MAEQCRAMYFGGYSNVFDCILNAGHDGDHVSFGGSSWSDLLDAGYEPTEPTVSDGSTT